MADQVIQRSFTAGELSPALRSRSDLEKYISGLAHCRNFIIRSQGGAYSRPGTRFIGELGDMARRARLIPFQFNTTQTYILVFEHLRVRVIMDGGYVLDSNDDIYELVTPYTEAELPRLVFTQDADVMTITHLDHDPATLSRSDHDSWTLTAINYASTVTPPDNVAVTTHGDPSTADDKTYRYVVTAIDDEGVESLPSAEVSHTVPALSVTSGSKVTWDAVSGAIYYRVYKDPSDGSGIYGWIGDSETTQFVDFNIAPVTSDSPPSDYLPFKDPGHKPATVGYYQQRQVFANTLLEPQAVFVSQSGIYNSMRSSSPARDDDAIFFTIKARQVNEIRHIVSIDELLLLTSGGEWRVTEGQDEVLTPATVGVKQVSRWGSSWCAPAQVGDSVIFVQEKGTKVRDLKYEVGTGGYQGNELSILAEHLFEGHEIEEISYALEPYGILWCVRNDGVMLGLTYLREHSVWAWHQHHTKGCFESVATISEDGRDAVYVIVKREINGATVRYVERFEPRWDTAPEDVFCVDSGLSYHGAPATTISGLQHLEGEAVAVVADGVVVEGLTVTGGEITLSRAASTVHVGLPYLPVLETLPLDMPVPMDTLKGKEIAFGKVRLEVYRSRGGWVGMIRDDGSYGEMMEIKPRYDSYGYAPAPLASFVQDVLLPPERGKSPSLRIEQRAPMPLAILSIIPDVDVS